MQQLREAQVYAERLLQPRFSPDAAQAIAHDLVTRYPTHEFVINREEAKKIGEIIDPKTSEKKPPVGLHVIALPSDAIRTEIDWLRKNIGGISAMGRIVPA